MLKQFTPASRPLRRWRLLQVHRRFEESGGTVREHVAAEGVTVHPDGVSLDVKDGAITARLLVDCMGNFGPIVRQVHRLPQETKEMNTQKQHVGCFPAHCQAGTLAPAGKKGDEIPETTCWVFPSPLSGRYTGSRRTPMRAQCSQRVPRWCAAVSWSEG